MELTFTDYSNKQIGNKLWTPVECCPDLRCVPSKGIHEIHYWEKPFNSPFTLGWVSDRLYRKPKICFVYFINLSMYFSYW